MTTDSSIIALKNLIHFHRAALATDRLVACDEMIPLLQELKFLKAQILIGYNSDSNSLSPYYVSSASYFLTRTTSASLSELHVSLVGGPESALHSACSSLGVNIRNSIRCRTENTICLFRVGDKFAPAAQHRSTLQMISDLYSAIFLKSINYQNAMNGQVYYFSKPRSVHGLHPKFASINDICDLLTKKYPISCRHFWYLGTTDQNADMESGDLRETQLLDINRKGIREFIECPKKLLPGPIRHTIQLKQPSYACSQSSKGRLYLLVFPVFDPAIRRSVVEGVVLIWSRQPIKRIVFQSADRWLREFSAKRHIQKIETLSDLRAQIDLQLREMVNDRRFSRYDKCKMIRSFVQKVCDEICRLTNAESAAYLDFDIIHEKLVRVARCETEIGEYYPGMEGIVSEIDLDLWKTSAIAFCAKRTTTDEKVYIPDLKEVPGEYGDLGLKQALQARRHSRTEFAIRVYAGGALTGVLNVESPIEGALNGHVRFLSECATLIGEFETRLDSARDRVGFSSLAQTHIVTHDVAHDIREWHAKKEGAEEEAAEILKNLKAINRRFSAGDMLTKNQKKKGISYGTNSPTAFNRLLRSWLQREIRSGTYDLKPSDVLKGGVPRDFPSSQLPALAIILHSIIRNISVHTYLDAQALRFGRGFAAEHKANVLVIDWRSRFPLPEHIDLDRVFYEPLPGEEGPHYGMFLIGAHTRSLGGVVSLDNPSQEGGFLARILIPYEKANEPVGFKVGERL